MPFNGKIGPHRRIEWLGGAIDDVKAVKQSLGGTLNDVVLATVAGAMHRYFPARSGSTSARPRFVQRFR